MLKATSVVKGRFLSPLSLLQISRPKQWTKNLYVFAALIFSGNLLNIHDIVLSIDAFVAFCLISSAVYVLNDLFDIDKDRKHPKKMHRPLPSGRLSVPLAIGFLVVLAVASSLISVSLSNSLFWILALYFCINVAYSVYLKHQFLVEAFIVGIGFVLRAMAGANVIHVRISPWLFVCTILISLFLVLGKRRSELIRLGEDAARHRKVLSFYTVEMLDQFITVVIAATIMAYSLYSFSENYRHQMMFTIPFVIYGLFRYVYILSKKDIGDSPEEALYTDLPSVINITVWALCSYVLLYHPLHLGIQ